MPCEHTPRSWGQESYSPQRISAMNMSAHDVDDDASGYGGDVEGRSTRRAVEAGVLDHLGPVCSAERSNPGSQDVTINVRGCAIHRCVWIRPSTRRAAVRGGPAACCRGVIRRGNGFRGVR
jgi:hypothetical protein